MEYLDLSQIKKHLNIDAAFTDDDEYIESLGDVAEAIVSRHIDRNLEDILIDGELPAPIRHACQLYIGNMYMNRESVSNISMIDIPKSYEYLLATYKNRSNFRT